MQGRGLNSRLLLLQLLRALRQQGLKVCGLGASLISARQLLQGCCMQLAAVSCLQQLCNGALQLTDLWVHAGGISASMW